MKAWVLWWRYGDGSSAGVVRVYHDDARAAQDLDLIVNVDSGREYFLSEVPVYGEEET